MSLGQPYEPQLVDDLQLVFPAGVSDLMPEYEDIPEDFRRNRGAARPWVQFQRDWFYRGVDASGMVAKPGVNGRVALRHLSAIQGSFEPRHEYKEAAVSFLASLWFESPGAPGGE